MPNVWNSRLETCRHSTSQDQGPNSATFGTESSNDDFRLNQARHFRLKRVPDDHSNEPHSDIILHLATHFSSQMKERSLRAHNEVREMVNETC